MYGVIEIAIDNEQKYLGSFIYSEDAIKFARRAARNPENDWFNPKGKAAKIVVYKEITTSKNILEIPVE